VTTTTIAVTTTVPVTTTTSASLTNFVGTWYVHAGQLVIAANGEGVCCTDW
jgi:DNA replicative helicase MCM subunit Mcm2 (Cdc46/Mcm family)